MVKNGYFFLFMILTTSLFADVDLKTANYTESWVDVRVPGSGFELAIQRTYNSRSSFQGAFGYGWCSTLESKLVFKDIQTILLVECGAGQITTFYLSGASGSKYLALGSSRDTIEKSDSGYVRTSTLESKQKFNLGGKLEKIVDKNGSSVSIIYKDSRISEIKASNGPKIIFSWNTAGFVSNVVGSNGLGSQYRYLNGDLVWVKNSEQTEYSYSYSKSHNLTKVTFPDGTAREITYDEKEDWVTAFKDLGGCSEGYKFSVQAEKPIEKIEARVTKNCGGSASRSVIFSWTYQYRKGRPGKYLKQSKEESGTNLRVVTYNEMGDIESDRINRNETRYKYAGNGNLISINFPDGTTTKYTYRSGSNRLTKIDSGTGVLSFHYDANGNIDSSTSNDGRSIALKYDSLGRIIEIKNNKKQEFRLFYEPNSKNLIRLVLVGVGELNVKYEQSGLLSNVRSPAGESVGLQIAAAFKDQLKLLPSQIDIVNL